MLGDTPDAMKTAWLYEANTLLLNTEQKLYWLSRRACYKTEPPIKELTQDVKAIRRKVEAALGVEL